MANQSEIVRAQCERTAKEYYAFRKKGGTANDLVEIPAMKRLIGDIRGKKVIDCGCGFGSYSIYCAKLGAIVTAVDISQTMIQFAKQEAAEAKTQIDFRVQDVTCMEEIPSNSFDLAISSIVICFDMPQLFNEISRVLKRKGVLCFSEVHPMLDIESDDYFCEGLRKANNVFGKLNPSDPDYEWQWKHYTLEDYFAGLRNAGFIIDDLLEPKPDPTTKDLNPDLYFRAIKRPIFILIRAVNMKKTK
jgi:ubiquinone/menaquinone biosynthesis C-methylase UbiE